MAFLWVALGGAIGAVGRYSVVQWAVTRWGSTFPWGTLAVNVTGSLAIGILAALLSSRQTDPMVRLLLITGVLGGYTTFSAFSLETLTLIYEQRSLVALAYAAGSVLLGTVAAGIGYALAMHFGR